VFVKNDRIVVRDEDGKWTEICGTEELLIPGAHNLENALAGTAIAHCAGISGTVIAETLRTFKGVEHRLELCREFNGVRFINDSKGTNPDASIKAVEAVDAPVILIAGGFDKNANFEEWIETFGGKVKHMMLLGATAKKIKETAERKGFYQCVILKDMEACVNAAFAAAVPGDTVLLSPACASWDMYACFEERGEHFKNCVKRLGS
jgi:UDP-N-acetylmuramoylalanine--D-glutamate ligase